MKESSARSAALSGAEDQAPDLLAAVNSSAASCTVGRRATLHACNIMLRAEELQEIHNNKVSHLFRFKLDDVMLLDDYYLPSEQPRGLSIATLDPVYGL